MRDPLRERCFAAFRLTLRGAIALALVVGAAEKLSAHGLRVISPSLVTQDSASVAAVIDRFHAALARGDTAAVLELLLPDVAILESGGIETLSEYVSGHLPADIAYARAVPRERGPIRVTVRGDVAWAASTSTSRGEYRGRAINSASAELIVLRRTEAGWRIAAIHWSSRQLRS